jgi:hypothetical protein
MSIDGIRACIESYLKAQNTCTFRKPISTFVRLKPAENLFRDSRLDLRRRLPQILPGVSLPSKLVPYIDHLLVFVGNNWFQRVHRQPDLPFIPSLKEPPVVIERKIRVLTLQDLDWFAVY